MQNQQIFKFLFHQKAITSLMAKYGLRIKAKIDY